MSQQFSGTLCTARIHTRPWPVAARSSTAAKEHVGCSSVVAGPQLRYEPEFVLYRGCCSGQKKGNAVQDCYRGYAASGGYRVALHEYMGIMDTAGRVEAGIH